MKSFEEMKKAKIARLGLKSSPERKPAMDQEGTRSRQLGQRLGKQERQLYRPPAAKTGRELNMADTVLLFIS